jgi:two-component system CheB/CheR fusion protein
MLNIDALKRGQDFAEALAETVREPLVILGKDLKLRNANRALYQTFKVTKAMDAKGKAAPRSRLR